MTIEHELLQHQITVGVPETLSVSFYEDGAVADPGVTTIGIADEAGTEIVASGTATSGSGSNPRTYDLAAQSDPNLLVITWTTANYGDLTSRVEIVGAQLFTIREARTFDNNALSSSSDYPLEHIEESRARITDAFKHAMGVSHIPRYKRLAGLFGSGSAWLFLPDLHVSAVRNIEYRASGETDWTAFTVDELADVHASVIGVLQRHAQSWTSGTEYRVTYEYGYPSPPLEIKRAALRLLVSYIGATRSDWDPRATSMSTEAGVVSLATPGRAGSIFGLPEVDAVIHRYDESIPAVG